MRRSGRKKSSLQLAKGSPDCARIHLTAANAHASGKAEGAYAQAVRHALGGGPALVDVRREPTRIVASVQVPASHGSPAGMSAVADRARKAVREHDPYVGSIDVNVVCYPDPE